MLTTGIVAGSQDDAARSLAFPYDMACRRRRKQAMLSNQQLLDTIRTSDFRNQLRDFRVPEPSVAANDKEGTCRPARSERGFAAKRCGIGLAFCALGDREQDACDESLAVVRLLEDGDLLAKPGPAMLSVSRPCEAIAKDLDQ
jgi:hypothetical protein